MHAFTGVGQEPSRDYWAGFRLADTTGGRRTGTFRLVVPCVQSGKLLGWIVGVSVGVYLVFLLQFVGG